MAFVAGGSAAPAGPDAGEGLDVGGGGGVPVVVEVGAAADGEVGVDGEDAVADAEGVIAEVRHTDEDRLAQGDESAGVGFERVAAGEEAVVVAGELVRDVPRAAAVDGDGAIGARINPGVVARPAHADAEPAALQRDEPVPEVRVGRGAAAIARAVV